VFHWRYNHTGVRITRTPPFPGGPVTCGGGATPPCGVGTTPRQAVAAAQHQAAGRMVRSASSKARSKFGTSLSRSVSSTMR